MLFPEGDTASLEDPTLKSQEPLWFRVLTCDRAGGHTKRVPNVLHWGKGSERLQGRGFLSNPEVSRGPAGSPPPPSCLHACSLQVLRQTSLQVGPWPLAQPQQPVTWRVQTKWKTSTELNRIIVPLQQQR